MKSRRENLIDLLHGCPDAALATHSLAVPGFPFATALPFATDEHHRPVFLISRLAEHTQNLAADPRASLLVRRLLPEGEMVRATVVGNVRPIDATPLLEARYLRYQPDAERFLQLGDFRFFRLEPAQARIVGGFAQAAWLAGDRLTDSRALSLSDEAELLDSLRPLLPATARLLGIDCHGVDLYVAGERRRSAFGEAPVANSAVFAAVQRIVNSLQD
jgi:heme iron utilization protein